MLRDLGQGVNAASTGMDVGRIEWLAGDLVTAEREVQADLDFLAQRGETYFLSSMAAQLSCIVRDLGDDARALELSLTAEQAAAEDDTVSHILWRVARAPLIARTGELAEAESLVRRAIELARSTDAPIFLADALVELGAVLSGSGRGEEARAAIDEAIALYGEKGDTVSITRALALLTSG
jgi:Flp pilus assembly protein TadD